MTQLGMDVAKGAAKVGRIQGEMLDGVTGVAPPSLTLRALTFRRVLTSTRRSGL